MKKFSVLSYMLLVAMTLSSCLTPLDYNIWNPDPDDPNMPAYSEWGYNTFGANYGRGYFLYDKYNSQSPFQIVYQEGKLRIYMNGRHSQGGAMQLEMEFPFQKVSSYFDLIALQGQDIDLTGTGCAVYLNPFVKHIGETTSDKQVTLISGHFKVIRAQRLRVDGEEQHLILSGVFDLSFLSDQNLPEGLTKGRFDIALKSADFYSFDE